LLKYPEQTEPIREMHQYFWAEITGVEQQCCTVRRTESVPEDQGIQKEK